MKKTILAIFSILLLASCSKDDAVATPDNVEAKYRVEITHEGNKEAFTEFVTLALVATSENITLTGLDDFQVIVEDNIHNFIPTTSSIPTDREMETSENVLSATVVVTMSPADATPEDSLNTTISIYRNDELLKSDSYTFNGSELGFFSLSSQ